MASPLQRYKLELLRYPRIDNFSATGACDRRRFGCD
jgi:hypothetical protein